MSYNPAVEALRELPMERIAKELEDFAATGEDLSGRRFSRSPPRVPSALTTEYEETEPPSPNTQLQDKENKEREKSTADEQFAIQIQDELHRIHAAIDKDLVERPLLLNLDEAAQANVKYRWIQQGIWDERWEGQPGRIWKHELQDPQSRMGPSDLVKDAGITDKKTKHKRKHSELEKEYHETVRRAVDYQNRQSSRPCYQFLYQLCQEREWIKMGLSDQDQEQQTNLDTKAYDILKSRWIRDGIWDADWTFVPGTSWRHERPRKTADPQGTYQWEDARKAASIERAERPLRWYFMAPVAPLMRIEWPSTRPMYFDSPSDQSGPTTARPRAHSITSRTHKHTGSPVSTRKSTARAKSSLDGQEDDEPQTTSTAGNTLEGSTSPSPAPKAVQEHKINISQPSIGETRSVKRRISTRKKKNRRSVPVVRQQETANEATASRPRRAAALKAIKNLTKTI